MPVIAAGNEDLTGACGRVSL